MVKNASISLLMLSSHTCNY